MKFLVDTCGWLEWLTDGVLADEFAPYLNDSDNLIIPTSIQYELHKWICRERDVVLAMEIIELTQQSTVIPLTQSLALLASELSQKHKLSFADSIIYATAQQESVKLITSDNHKKKMGEWKLSVFRPVFLILAHFLIFQWE
ncbi:type II toxin-antitoxin system VapC family toxin [Planktothrix prolifica]|uniref:type II toxin-antitoxin system VapC family toxin n=1 Tax=Planktothrix prolifica TaxID=54307 RepID=UPI0005C4B41B|nr:type II toxin-antitoxin system VapC family toxin [Planktothrix prolifica]